MKKTSKHLTLEDHIVIERLLAHGFRFSEKATRLSKSRTTISREVKKNRTFKARNGNHCIHRKSCDLPTTCSQECHKRTRSCRVRCGDCNIHCERFQEDICPGITKAPYVCECQALFPPWWQIYLTTHTHWPNILTWMQLSTARSLLVSIQSLPSYLSVYSVEDTKPSSLRYSRATRVFLLQH